MATALTSFRIGVGVSVSLSIILSGFLLNHSFPSAGRAAANLKVDDGFSLRS